MSEMEDRLSSLLGNPQIMSQVMAMANQLGSSGQNPPKEEPAKSTPAFDPGMLQNVMRLSQGGGISKEQRELLRALSPFLSKDRIARLERAMEAAFLAQTASAALSGGNGR